MTKLLDQAIAKARTLSEAEQDAAALALFAHLAGDDVADIPLDEATRQAIREGLEQLDRGEVVADAEIAALWKRHGV